jgi:hypothetical protein
MGWGIGAAFVQLVVAVVGGTFRWVGEVLTPDPARSHPSGLSPQLEGAATVVSGLVVWLIGVRIGGLTFGTAVTPFFGFLSSGAWYAIAIVIGGLVLLAAGVGGSRRQLLRACSGPLTGIGLLVAFYAALVVVAGTVGTAPSALDSGPGDGVLAELGKIALGLVVALLMLVLFLAVVAGLVSTLWHGARHRFRAAEVHSYLPPVTDVIVALCLVGVAVQELVQTGSAGSLVVEAVSAGFLMALAGANLVSLARAPAPSGPAGPL